MSKYSDNIRFLKSYEAYKHEEAALLRSVEEIQNDIDTIRSRMMDPSVKLSDMPHGGGESDPMAAYIVKVEALIDKKAKEQSRLVKAIEKTMEQRKKVHKAICDITDAAAKEVLMRRYIGLDSWFDITEDMCYSRTAVNQLHNRGVGQIRIPEKK